jgi:photosystem II stability/assembly factor-like uncharacterized protein
MKHLSRVVAAAATSILLLVMVAPAAPGGAQTDNTSRHLPPKGTINHTAVADATNGVAVGNGGVISTTTDGGVTWKARTSGTTVSLFAAEYLPPAANSGACTTNGCIWVAGANGTLLLSTDRGATFCAQSTGTTATLYGLVANGAQDLVAVGSGGTVIVTDRRAGTGGTADQCGAAALYRPAASGTTRDLFDIDTDGFELYISGAAGTLLKATPPQSGGPGVDNPPLFFTSLASGTNVNLYGVASTSDGQSTRIVAVGDGGTIVAGTSTFSTAPTFTSQKSGTANTLRDVEMVTLTQGFAVGDLGTVLNTVDGGVTWTKATSGTCANLQGAEFASTADQTWYASGDRGTVIVNTANAAATQPNCATTPLGANGYRMVAADGGIFTFGARNFWGSTGDQKLNKPIVGGATDVSDYEGYWIVASDGGVFTFSADFYGSAVGLIDSPAVEIEPTPTGKGYWIVTANGKVLPFGDAKSQGDMSGKGLNQPIIGMTVTQTGLGYWLVGQDGGIFSFGDAQFFGSTGDKKLNAPVIDLAPSADNQGYYLVAKDGGVFTFGSAEFKGSTGDLKLNAPVIAMLVSPNGAGYWLAATDGGIFTFGAVDFLGSMGGTKLNSPVLDLIN